MFLVKEGHLNNSILEDSLLAYLLYKYTLYRTFIINIKVKCFYYKANIAFKSTHLQLQNFNEKFNLAIFWVVKKFCMILGLKNFAHLKNIKELSEG